MTLVALLSVWFITSGSFWSTWKATRWVLPPAASAGADSAIVIRRAAARRRSMEDSSTHQFVIARSDSDEAIQRTGWGSGLLRCARNDAGQLKASPAYIRFR